MQFKVTTVILSVLVLSVWLISCVDVPSTGPPTPEFNASFRFINAAEDLGDVGISVDGTTVATVSFGAETPTHDTYPAGSRQVSLSNGDTFPVAMTTDQRGTVLLLPLTGTIREFIKLIEGGIFDQPVTTTAIRIVHASPDAGDVEFTLTGADTISGTASYRSVSAYSAVPAGDYTYTIVTAAGDTTEASVSLGNMRHTAVLMGSVANTNVTVVGFADN